MIDGQNFQSLENDLTTYDSVQKTETVQGDDYTTGCLLDYHYFKEHHNMIAIHLSKLNELDVDLKAIQEIFFAGNLNQDEFPYWIRERNHFGFFPRTVKVF